MTPLVYVDGWRDGKVVSWVRLPLPIAIRHAKEATAACERTVFKIREEQLNLLNLQEPQ